MAIKRVVSEGTVNACVRIANLRVRENSAHKEERATAEIRCNLEEITGPMRREKVSSW